MSRPAEVKEPRRGAARRFRRIAGRLALACAVTLVALGLGEGALRLAGVWKPDPPIYPGDRVPRGEAPPGLNVVNDARLGWRMRAGAAFDQKSDEYTFHVTCNSAGFRSSREFVAEPGVRRIAFLGDSFTFGNGVEEAETFVALVEADRAGVRAFNFGIPGFGVDQMWQTLEHVALPLRPHLVVVTFILDDLKRSLDSYRFRDGWVRKPSYTLSGGRLEPLTEANAPSGIARWAERNLHVAEAGTRLLERLSLTTPVTLGRRWSLNFAIFRAIRDACRRAGIPLIVMYVPPVERWEPVASFERAFRELEIPFVDLGREPVSDHRGYFFARDRHFNAEGHRFARDALEPALSRAGFPKP